MSSKPTKEEPTPDKPCSYYVVCIGDVDELIVKEFAELAAAADYINNPDNFLDGLTGEQYFKLFTTPPVKLKATYTIDA